MEVYKILIAIAYIIWTILSINYFIKLRTNKVEVGNSGLFMFMLFWFFGHILGIIIGFSYLVKTYVSFEWLFYKIELWK